MRMFTRTRRRTAGLLGDERGVAGLEFALVAPIIALVMAATVDIGIEIFLRSQLDDSLSAASNYALVNASQVSSAGGAALATATAGLVANMHGTRWATSTVTVNAGPTATSAGGSSGAASAASSCYCPTGSASALTWGNPQTCGVACSAGGAAGKFVLVTASVAYTPLFPRFGLTVGGQLTSASLVKVQ
jgi:Flp pilus assembly protein TadG